MKKSMNGKIKLMLSAAVCLLLIQSLSNDIVVQSEKQSYNYDVGVKSINYPSEDGPGQTFPVQATIENFGQNTSCCISIDIKIGELVLSDTLLEESSWPNSYPQVPATGWTDDHKNISYLHGWRKSYTFNSGGTTPEACLPNNYALAGYQFYSYAIDTSAYSLLMLRFKSYIDHSSGQGLYSLEAGYSTDEETWYAAWHEEPDSSGQYMVDVPILGGSATTYIGFWIMGDPSYFNNWYIDDVDLVAIDLIEEYSDSHGYLDDIEPGEEITFEFEDWTPEFLAEETTGSKDYIAACFIEVDGDQNPGNDIKTEQFTLDYWHDIGVESITSPEESIFPGIHSIEAIVANYGTFPEFDQTASAEIKKEGVTVWGPVYLSDLNLDLPLGGTEFLDFGTYNFSEQGCYELTVCIPLYHDDSPDNNCLNKTICIDADPVDQYSFSGYVYTGNIGNESSPHSGVIVEVYCSNDADFLGTLIGSTVTDSDGWFEFVFSDTCGFYNILETDPLGYTSLGAASESGSIISNNLIQYEYPLDNKTLSGNKFWDYIEVDPSLADLVISDFGNKTNILWYNIKNIGNGTAPKGYNTALFVDGIYIISDLVSVDLESGEQWNSSFNYSWNCTEPDDNIEIVADYDNDVVEQNETNNRMNKKLICGVNNPPYTPNNPNPSNKAKDVDITVNINWIGDDPDGHPVTYDVYFGMTSPPPKVINNQTATFYNPGVMNNHTTYYWKIIAWDPYRLKSESGIWMFSTGPPKDQFPLVPTVIISIGGPTIIYTIRKYIRKKPKKKKKDEEEEDEEDEEEEEKTDFLISAVKYNKKHSHIVKVKTHEYKDKKIRKSYVIEDRETVLINLHNTKIYRTAIKDNYGRWFKGEKIRIIKIKNKDYLRTDNNKTNVDNLEELPEF